MSTDMSKIGTLFLYRCPSGFYDRQGIIDVFAKHGLAIPVAGYELPTDGSKLDTGRCTVPYLPTPPSDADAFRKGTSEAARSWRNLRDVSGRTVRVSVVDVHSDSEYIQKDVMQLIQKAKTVSDLHENEVEASIAKIVWRSKAPGSFDDKFKVRPTHDLAEAISQGIWAEFPHDEDGKQVTYVNLFEDMRNLTMQIKQFVNDVQMRAFVNDYILLYLGGAKYSEVRGTMFVPPETSEMLEKFAMALRELESRNNSKAIFAQCVPLYDEGTLLADMKEFLAGDMEGQLRDMIDEIDVKVGMRSDKLKRLTAEVARFEAMVKQYDDMVDAKKLTTLLKLAKSKLGMSEKQSEITKEKKAAARAYEAEKKADKTDRGERPSGKTSNRDKLAAESPKNRTGLFGNQGEKAS